MINKFVIGLEEFWWHLDQIPEIPTGKSHKINAILLSCAGPVLTEHWAYFYPDFCYSELRIPLFSHCPLEEVVSRCIVNPYEFIIVPHPTKWGTQKPVYSSINGEFNSLSM
jgi:hypothetical protein